MIFTSIRWLLGGGLKNGFTRFPLHLLSKKVPAEALIYVWAFFENWDF